jgi:hypothetical protein
MATYMDAVNGNHTNQPRYDPRHGGPYDRGSSDSYYGRGYNPHYFEGATSITPRVEMAQMTAEEITAYTAGFNDNESFGDKKDWG